MHFVSMVVNANNHAGSWMWNHYNLYYVPTIYFAGGTDPCDPDGDETPDC